MNTPLKNSSRTVKRPLRNADAIQGTTTTINPIPAAARCLKPRVALEQCVVAGQAKSNYFFV